MSTISKFICALLVSSAAIGVHAAETAAPDSLRERKAQGVQFADADRERLARLMGNRSVPTFAGLSLSADLAGAFLAATRGVGNYEAALRLLSSVGAFVTKLATLPSCTIKFMPLMDV